MTRIYLDNAATSWPKPESVYRAVDDYQRRLGAPAGRSVYSEANEAERLTGRLMTSLAYDRIEDIFGRGLDPFLTDVQKTSRQIGHQIAKTYFYYATVA